MFGETTKQNNNVEKEAELQEDPPDFKKQQMRQILRSITSNQVCSHQTSPSVIKDGNVIHLRLKLQIQELAKNREFRRMFISAPFPAFKLKTKTNF